MNEPAGDAHREVQQRIREFLDAVDSALSGADVPPDERSAILDDLRIQITDMLASRAGDVPGLSDLDAVLAEIDPPQAYAGPVAAEASRPDPSRCSNLAAVLRQAFAAWRRQSRYGREQFAQDAWDALQYADQEARRRNHAYLGTEHLLLGLLREEQGAAGKALRHLGVDVDRAGKEMDALLRPGPAPVPPGPLPRMPRLGKALDAAIGKMQESHGKLAGTQHLLFGLLAVPDGLACRVLTERFGLARDAMIRQAGLTI